MDPDSGSLVNDKKFAKFELDLASNILGIYLFLILGDPAAVMK